MPYWASKFIFEGAKVPGATPFDETNIIDPKTGLTYDDDSMVDLAFQISNWLLLP